MAYMVDEVFIVYKISHNGLHTVPSVWTSRVLAEAAVIYHESNSHHGDTFMILERKLNVANKNG